MQDISIEFAAKNFRISGPERPKEMWQNLLWVVADMEIRVSGRAWFQEESFPVVEFAAQLKPWLKNGGEFNYDSMEADESLLRLSPCIGGYRIESPWQSFAVEVDVMADLVLSGAEAFIGLVCLELGRLDITMNELCNG